MAIRNLCSIALPIYHQTCLSSTRQYARWMNRRPANVLLPFEPPTNVNLKKEKVIDLTESHSKRQDRPENSNKLVLKHGNKEEPSINAWTSEKSVQVKTNKENKLTKRKFYLSQLKVFDENNDIIYEKLNENDGRISSILIKMKSKKERARSGMTLVEGWRLIVDGLEAKCKLRYLIISRVEDLKNLKAFLPQTGVKIYKMSYKEMQLWSDTDTPPGIFGIFDTPTPENIKISSKPLPLQLICDNIRVPGNLGAILRVAAGAGCEKVLLTKGCVDVWDSKVIRSAAGAHFRLPIHNSIDWEQMPKLIASNTSIFIADSNEKMTLSKGSENIIESTGNLSVPLIPYYGVEYSAYEHITLIIGGETEGISQESYELAASRNGIRINIPLQKGVDSLNSGMAAAVLAFEVKKQLMQAHDQAHLEINLLKA